MWYFVEDNEIKMTASQETDLCKIYTDEEIVTTVDNRLVLKHETGTEEYKQLVESMQRQKYNEKRISEIQQRLNDLSQDFIQAQIGAQIDDLGKRKEEFRTLHNELRQLLGKEPRNYNN